MDGPNARVCLTASEEVKMPTQGARQERILVLGGAGMLGHKMFQVLGRRFGNTACTIRRHMDDQTAAVLARVPGQVIEGVDVSKMDDLIDLLRQVRPTVIVNCVGAVKQRAEAHDSITAITLNSLLPHRVALAAEEWGGRVIHFSTDCVFTGNKGHYVEDDEPDATDLYGRSKVLGEPTRANTLTLRVSFIGREIHHHQSLLEWFLTQENQRVRGFRQTWWSGVTTVHLAEVIADLLEHHPTLRGVYHLSSGRISKYDLLVKLRTIYGLDVEIEPDDSVVCDRSLDGTRFEQTTGYQPPPWDVLLAQLVSDPTAYPSLVRR